MLPATPLPDGSLGCHACCTGPRACPLRLALQTVTELSDVLAARARAGEAEEAMDEAGLRVTLDVITRVGFGYDIKARTYAPCELFQVC